MKNTIIIDFDLIDELNDELKNIREAIINYSCPADDCSECFINCPLDEWTTEADNIKTTIYRLQDGSF